MNDQAPCYHGHIMGFFDNIKNVRDYVKMADGYDGASLIRQLRKHLPSGSTLLELGMGPGTDLGILSRDYQVTGSDMSQVFLDLYREEHPEADLMRLDATSLETDRRFDCIYSNKVLHHLTREELVASLDRQKEILNPGGLLSHSFWRGDKEEEHQGLRFLYYMENDLSHIVGSGWDVLLMEVYAEMEDDDSIHLLATKR